MILIRFLISLHFLTLAATSLLDVRLVMGLKRGAHRWEVPVIVFAIVLLILGINASFLVNGLGERA